MTSWANPIEAFRRLAKMLRPANRVGTFGQGYAFPVEPPKGWKPELPSEPPQFPQHRYDFHKYCECGRLVWDGPTKQSQPGYEEEILCPNCGRDNSNQPSLDWRGRYVIHKWATLVALYGSDAGARAYAAQTWGDWKRVCQLPRERKRYPLEAETWLEVLRFWANKNNYTRLCGEELNGNANPVTANLSECDGDGKLHSGVGNQNR